MEKLLHINASPRGENSRTLKVSAEFLKHFRNKYSDCEIDELWMLWAQKCRMKK